MADWEAKATLAALPEELLYQIVSYLDEEAPSAGCLYAEPSSQLDITSRPSANLKSVSLVCHRLRKTVRPILYQNACLFIRPRKHLQETYQEALEPFLAFYKNNDLISILQSLTICVEEWNECGRSSTGSDDSLEDNLEELGIDLFWDTLFEIISPSHLTIVASPLALGFLVGCDIYLDDAWLFEIKYQILRLSTESQSRTSQTKLSSAGHAERVVSSDSSASHNNESRPSRLLSARPWTSLLLNEGSHVKAFHAYEYYHKRPPSIVPALLGVESPTLNLSTPLFPSTITSFQYIAVFPIQSHFQLITLAMPAVTKFHMQIVPDEQNPILTDAVQMQRIIANDLWMERNQCYSLVMRELFTNPPGRNWEYIEEFSSGDAADEDAWALAVSFVERLGSDWKVDGPGVFVRVKSSDHSTQNSLL